MLSVVLAALLMGGGQSPWRLPETVVPSHYRISLELDVEGERFSGDETIHVRVVAPVSEIVINSLGLEISSASVCQVDEKMALEVAVDEEHERVILTAPRMIAAGAAEVDITFSGPLKEGLRGLYLSRAGEDVYAATQMQGTYARMMFPCFDEPAFKATFELDVIVDAAATAISNGPLLSEESIPDSGRKHVRFGKSPLMSTYLVALAVGNFECLTETVGNVPVRICGRPEKRQELQFAMEVTREVLGFYDEWYGIPYPFGKLDMVAVPDYEWGGMENTAAIYYREVSLAVDTATSSPSRLQRVAGLVAHEIAHQWFGDLVTTAWWDDIWLNEGFASWMTPKAVARFNLEWSREEESASGGQWVMGLDALSSTRPIHGTAATPGEIKEMFDGIAYTKGAAILRMLEAWVGEETFREGVNAYLETHANGNARSEDLWMAISSASEVDVDAIMTSFVMQPGVPAVTFTTRPAEGATEVVLRQERFLSSGAMQKSNEVWAIPICFRAGFSDGERLDICELLEKEPKTVRLSEDLEWIVGNIGAKGYYRVAWTDSQLRALVDVIPTLSPTERMSVLSDAWAMTESGRLGVDAFLDFASSFKGERNQTVIEILSGAIGKVRRSLIGSGTNESFDAWTISLFADLADELGFEPRAGDDDEIRSLRAAVMSILSRAGEDRVLDSLRGTMDGYLEGPGSVDPSLASLAFNSVPSRGGEELFDKLESTLKSTKSNQMYDRCLTGLTRFSDAALVERAVRLPESGVVRLDRYPSYYESLLQNRSARDRTWSYLKANWNDLKTKVVSFGGRGAMRALGSFCSPKQRDDVKAFFAKNDVPGAERAVALSLEQVDTCIRFRDSQGDRFAEWLGR